MKRWEILNAIIKKRHYKDYLEIGVRMNGNFPKIKCKTKHGVDPKGNPTFKMTSDEFFKQNKKKYDLIFIDGLHIDKQVTRDIKNALKCLRKNGTIVLHDCNPKTKKAQDVPRQQKMWNGNVWKAFVRFRCIRKNLNMFVIDEDHGCGVIRRGSQKVCDIPLHKCLKWEYFKRHKKKLLNLKKYSEEIL